MKNLMLTGSLPTKSLISQKAGEVISGVEQGLLNPLETDMQLKMMEETIKEARSGIKRAALNEISKYHKNEAVLHGIKFHSSIAGVTYDYESDAEYARLKALADARLEKVKKATTAGSPILDEESGELIYPAPKKSFGSDSITYNIPK